MWSIDLNRNVPVLNLTDPTRKVICLPDLKFSDPLPETYLFLYLALLTHFLLCVYYFQNMVWSFGLNRNVPVLNLTDPTRKVIMYTCAHVGILYDFKSNRQHILQGHVRIEPRCEISKNVVCATSKSSDQPAHMQSAQNLC